MNGPFSYLSLSLMLAITSKVNVNMLSLNSFMNFEMLL